MTCRTNLATTTRIAVQSKPGIAVGSVVRFRGKVATRIDPRAALGAASGITMGTVPGTVLPVVSGMLSVQVSLTETNALYFRHLSQLRLVQVEQNLFRVSATAG
jgi:hypothetical protein